MSNTSFSTNEAVSLEKKVDLEEEIVETSSEDFDNVYEISKCGEWIQASNFKKVCLQFPDHLLSDSTEVSLRLQKLINQTVYILGDTAYESCCIDYIAAAHICADAIIHFGPVCFSKTSGNIPYLNIYEKYKLNINDFKSQFWETFNNNTDVVILLDTPYIHYFDDIVLAFKENKNVVVCRIDNITYLSNEKILIFLGKNERKITNIQLTFDVKDLYYFNDAIKKYQMNSLILKRRNYLIEKIRDSKTIGIIIGTLGVTNYLQVIDRLKTLISVNFKKYYLISVGKPTVAKLANFPEMDIYVAVTCSMSEIYENRDFYIPVATPYDIEVALNSNADKNIKFTYDYNYLINDFTTNKLITIGSQVTDVSLLTNKIRSLEPEENTTVDTNAVALKSDGTVRLNTNYGAGYLADRSWKGLEQNLGQTDVELAQEGRIGIAQKYKNEQV